MKTKTAKSLDVLLQGFTAGLYGCKSLRIDCFRLKVLRYCASKILVGEDHGPVHEVSEHGHELRVVAALEVLPGEVVVLGFRCVCGKDIAQDIFLSGEIPLVLIHPHGPAAGCGNLVAFQIQELI